MSKSWLHSRPNVPQPPFTLQPEAQSPASAQPRARTSSRSQLPYVEPQSAPMQRSRAPQEVPPVPPLPHPNPHAQAYASQRPKSSPTAASPPALQLRRMTAEDRAAYIREVDARNAQSAHELASPTLRPLRLSASMPSPALPDALPPMQSLPTPPSDDAALQAYLDQHYNEASTPAASPPIAAEPEPQPQATPDAEPTPQAEAAPNAQAQPATPPQDGTEPATYDNTASKADGSHRVPATRVYSIGGTPNDALVTVPAAAAGAGARAQAGSQATVEVFSGGQVVARITLPWGPARG